MRSVLSQSRSDGGSASTSWSAGRSGALRALGRCRRQPLSATRRAAFLGAALLGLTGSRWSAAQNFTWNVDADGAWLTAGNWAPALNSPPSTSTEFAVFGSVITANRAVSIPAATTVTVGGVTFSDVNSTTAGVAYDITNSGTITTSAVSVTGNTLALQRISGGTIAFATGTTLTITNNSGATGNSLQISSQLVTPGSLGVAVTGSGNTLLSGVVGSTVSGVQIVGGLTKSGTGVLTLSAANLYTGGTNVQGGTIALSGGVNRITSATALTLGSGANSGVLDLNAQTQNLSAISTSGTGTANEVTNSNATLATLNSTVAGTYAAPVTGNIALAKSTSTTLTLSVPNTYTGGTTITGGRVNFNATGSAGTGAVTVTPASGITLASNGTTSVTLANSFTLNSSASVIDIFNSGSTGTVFTLSGTISGAGNLTRGAGGGGQLVEFTGNTSGMTGNMLVQSGPIAFTGASSSLPTGNLNLGNGTTGAATSAMLLNGSFTRSLGTGAGSVQWTGTATAAGLAARGGDLTVNLGGASAGVTWGSSSFVVAGATLNLGSAFATGMVDFQNPIGLAGAARAILVDDNTAVTTDFARISGNLTGITSSGILKAGTGTLELTGNNSYSGITQLRGGTLVAGSSGAIPSGSVITFINATGSTTFAVANNVTATIGGVNLPAPYVGSTPAGAVITTFGNGVLNLFGDVTMPATGGWPLLMSGNIDLGSSVRTFNITDNSNLFFDVDTSANFSGTAGITTAGTGGLVLGGNSTYGGTTAIGGRIVWLEHSSALGSSNVLLGATSGSTASELNLILNGATVPNNITVRSGSTGTAFISLGLASASGTFSGNVTLNKNVTVGGGSASTLNLTGAISGGNIVTVNNFGATIGSTVLGGQSTYTGGTTLSAGSLLFGSSTTMSGPTIVDGPIGTGALTNTASTTRIGAVGAARTVNNSLTLTASTTAIGSQDLTLGGNISGAGGLTMTGSANLTMNGTNTYAGTTTVSTGRLTVNGTHVGGAAYSVAAPATLGGTGVITLASGASVTLNGTVAPGLSPGTLTFNTSGGGTTNLAPAGAYSWELNNEAGSAGVNWDRLALSAANVTATATPGQQFVIKIVSLNGSNAPGAMVEGSGQAWDPSTPKTWTIATAQAGAFTTTLARFIVDTAAFQNSNLGGFYLSTSGGGANLDVVYVPEPCGITTVLVASALPTLRRRRSRVRACALR